DPRRRHRRGRRLRDDSPCGRRPERRVVPRRRAWAVPGESRRRAIRWLSRSRGDARRGDPRGDRATASRTGGRQPPRRRAGGCRVRRCDPRPGARARARSGAGRRGGARVSVSAAPDVVVVGAGIMGAWTALRCQRAGWQTTLVDAFGAGHARATSGDETRILRSSHGADPFYAGWAREARSAWLAFGEEVGQRLFHQNGMLWFAHREDGFEAHSIATLTALGIPVERLDPAAVTDRWPQV